MLHPKIWSHGKRNLILLAALAFALCALPFYMNCRVQRPSWTSKRTILFWNTMFGDRDFYTGGGDIFSSCPVNDCLATHDRSYADVLSFDAVLFHGNELDAGDLPRARDPRQFYVFVNLESPANRPLIDTVYEDYFNATMTYRLDSDVTWTYGTVVDVRTGRIVAPSLDVRWKDSGDPEGNRDDTVDDGSLSTMIQGKTKPVAWFVSNCLAKSGRQEYVNELSKYITVDVYGKCGSENCPHDEDCFAEVAEPRYFFYLSFENSLCDDYVTEKLYNALRYNIVPVVYGGANYSLFAPPRSYVNALDFDTPKELADHLKWLMEHPLDYAAYFTWKRDYRIGGGIANAICKLCEFLHKRPPPRTYDPLSDWYSRSKCRLQEFLQHYDYVTGFNLRHKVPKRGERDGS